MTTPIVIGSELFDRFSPEEKQEIQANMDVLREEMTLQELHKALEIEQGELEHQSSNQERRAVMSGHTPFSELTKHFSAERLAKIQEETNRLCEEMTLQEQDKQHTALQGIRRISAGIVQDSAINSGRPIIEGTRVFVDRIVGHLENGMSTAKICHEYDLTPEQVMEVKQLSSEQVQYVKSYADALENADMG